MAYDPKDPADKKIVDKLIADALAEAAEEHESAVEGLKAKNSELLGKLKKAREGGGNPENVEKLEAQLEALQGELKTANKALKTATTERDTHKTAAETEAAYSKRLVVDNGLMAELTAVGVKKEFLPAVKKFLAEKVEQTIDGDNRTATVGGKPLSEFVKAWSQSDEGKIYVSAPANGGANAQGGKAAASDKTMARSAFEGMNPVAQGAYMKEGGTLTEG